MDVMGLLLFVSAGIGHTALFVYSLNWWYGLPLPHRLLSAIKFAHGVIVLAGVAALGCAWASPDRWFTPPPWADSTASAYRYACILIGAVIVPLITIARSLRRRPAVLLSNHTATVDLAAELGFKPVGRGRHRLLARLPGNEVFRVDFAERVVRLPRLPPAWDGLTILHLSDLHFTGTPDRIFYQELMRRCRDWDPDLVALTGDYVDGVYFHRWIIPTLGWLRWRIGCFAVLGNHDSWYQPDRIRRRLDRLGMKVLQNDWQQIDVRDQPLIIVGNSSPWFRPAPNLDDCPDAPFRLCLSHTPDNIGWARKNHVDLMLAGHVHGGQIRFPLIGSVLVPSLHSRRYDCGTFHEPPTVLHVSRGVGGQQPIRYNCRPEVTKLVLRTLA
jgi:predicted MPP superfamily phosphohydrolase